MYNEYPSQPDGWNAAMPPAPMPAVRHEMGMGMAEMDERYPEVYKRMMPYVNNVMDGHNGGPLSEEDLDRMSNDAVEASRIMGDLPAGHNRNTIRDIARAMLVGGLVSSYGHNVPFYPFPYYLMPVPGFGHGHFGHHGNMSYFGRRR